MNKKELIEDIKLHEKFTKFKLGVNLEEMTRDELYLVSQAIATHCYMNSLLNKMEKKGIKILIGNYNE